MTNPGRRVQRRRKDPGPRSREEFEFGSECQEKPLEESELSGDTIRPLTSKDHAWPWCVENGQEQGDQVRGRGGGESHWLLHTLGWWSQQDEGWTGSGV